MATDMTKSARPGNPVRYGLIGAGMMGCEHILNLAKIPQAEVVAIAEPNGTPRGWAEACCGERFTPRWFDSHTDMLEACADDLDVIVIATPNMTHIDVLRDTMRTDIAIMCEKPMCTTIEDALEVHRLAAERQAMTWVALEYRYMPTVERFAHLVHEGAAGRPAMLRISEHRFPFLPKVDDWNRFNANTGGTFVEKCCHFFDLMRLTLGENPTTVYAVGHQRVNHVNESYDGRTPDILDHGIVTVSFPSGASAILDLCMFAEGAKFEQELALIGDEAKIETTVPGQDVWVRPRHTPAFAVDAPLADEVAYEGFHHGSSFREHLRLLEALAEGRSADVTTADGVWSVAMGAAAHRSIELGTPVSLADLLPANW